MIKQPEPSRLLRYKQVAQMLNLSVSTIRRLQHEGDFPRAFSVGSRAVAFDRAEVMEWLLRKRQAGQSD